MCAASSIIIWSLSILNIAFGHNKSVLKTKTVRLNTDIFLDKIIIIIILIDI